MIMIMSENHKPVIVVDAGKVLVDIETDAVLQVSYAAVVSRWAESRLLRTARSSLVI